LGRGLWRLLLRPGAGNRNQGQEKTARKLNTESPQMNSTPPERNLIICCEGREEAAHRKLIPRAQIRQSFEPHLALRNELVVLNDCGHSHLSTIPLAFHSHDFPLALHPNALSESNLRGQG